MSEIPGLKLLDAATEDGPGPWVKNERAVPREFYHRTIVIEGELDGATVGLEGSLTGEGDGIPLRDGESATNEIFNLSVRVPFLRAVLAGAGAGTEVTVWLR